MGTEHKDGKTINDDTTLQLARRARDIDAWLRKCVACHIPNLSEKELTKMKNLNCKFFKHYLNPKDPSLVNSLSFALFSILYFEYYNIFHVRLLTN